jgi:hypothetical protein
VFLLTGIQLKQDADLVLQTIDELFVLGFRRVTEAVTFQGFIVFMGGNGAMPSVVPRC